VELFATAIALKGQPEVRRYAINSAGASLFKLQRHSEALARFDEAAEAAQRAGVPPDAQLRRNRAAALLKLGRHAESMAEYDGIVAADPADLAARLNRAEARRDAGMLLEGAEDYIATLERMTEDGTDEIEGGSGGEARRVPDIYSDAVYLLQRWERRDGVGGGEGAEPALGRLWARLQAMLENVVRPHAAPAAQDGDCGLSQEECEAVTAVLSPAWAANASALSAIRSALAEGRPVHIRGVSCPDIAAIWVAFFSRCQRYRRC